MSAHEPAIDGDRFDFIAFMDFMDLMDLMDFMDLMDGFHGSHGSHGAKFGIFSILGRKFVFFFPFLWIETPGKVWTQIGAQSVYRRGPGRGLLYRALRNRPQGASQVTALECVVDPELTQE